MIYYAVFTNKTKEPEAIFKKKRQADKYVDSQKLVWSYIENLKFTTREVNIPNPNRKKLTIVHKITWIDYIMEGIGLLLTNIKAHAKR